MRTATPEFIALLERDETNFTFICEIRKRSSAVVRLSACIGDVTYGGDTFYGSSGFTLSSMTSAAFGQAPQVDMQIPVSPTGPITPDEIAFGALDSAEVTIWMIDYVQPDQGRMTMFRGKISSVSITDSGSAQFQIEGFASDLMELVVETYATTCPALLGDARCKKNLSAFTFNVTVATAISRMAFTLTTAPGGGDGWFANGALKFTSGLNNGFAFDIRSWTASTKRIELWMPVVGDIVSGDTLQIVAGCDKLPSTCRTKFSNIINFQGFPFLPSKSQLECGNGSATADETLPKGSVITIEC